MKYKLHNCYQDSSQPRSQGSLSCFVTLNSSLGTSKQGKCIFWIWPKPRGSNMYSGTCYSLWKVKYRGEVCLLLFFWNNVLWRSFWKFWIRPVWFSVCLVSCKQEGTRLTTHTKFTFKSSILITSDTNISIHCAFKKCFYRIHHTDEILSSRFSSYR